MEVVRIKIEQGKEREEEVREWHMDFTPVVLRQESSC